MGLRFEETRMGRRDVDPQPAEFKGNGLCVLFFFDKNIYKSIKYLRCLACKFQGGFGPDGCFSDIFRRPLSVFGLVLRSA
jgi:hypothetical protein